jgi:hypothetical protein
MSELRFAAEQAAAAVRKRISQREKKAGTEAQLSEMVDALQLAAGQP